MSIRRRVVATAIGVAGLLTGHGTAVATTTASTSTNRCSVTAKAPTLNAKKQLTGSVSVVCTAATVVTVNLTVVEMDGTLEDARVLVVAKTFTTTVRASTAMTVNTNTATCVSTETGNEEYATKARVNISGAVSTWDRTVPANDSFAC